MATLFSIQRSHGGVPKLAVEHVWISTLGLEGDSQRDTIRHGGPDRAVCLFSAECIEALADEGHPIAPGTTGENLTIRGLDWPAVIPGRRLCIGKTCVLEVTRYTTPCKTIAGSFIDGNFGRILHTKHPGWSRVYARVLTEGLVRTGETVELV